MKKAKSRPSFEAIRDKNLYGRKFFSGGFFYLVFGLIMQFFAYFLLTPQYLVFYIPLYFIAIFLLSAPFAKNLWEFHPMNLSLAYMMLYTSVFAKVFVLYVPFPFGPTFNLLTWFVVVSISEIAFLSSLVSIVVVSQRGSLRIKIGLLDKLFDKEKDVWKRELKGFPNLDKVVDSLDEGRFIASLFENGYFNLTVLWSCSVMEKAVDSIQDGMISKNPENIKLFEEEKGKRLAYTRKLRNLGFNDKDYQLDFERVWHKIRDRVAHHTHKPTFEETEETLKTLITFTREMPKILQKQVSS